MAEQAALQIGVAGRKSSLRDQNNFAVRFRVRGQGILEASGISGTIETHGHPGGKAFPCAYDLNETRMF